MSPAYAWAADGVEAFRAVQVVNVDRRGVCRRPRLLPRAACRDVRVEPRGRSAFGLVPATAYSALVMTEPLFYPLFVAAALALIVTLERPTPARQLLTVALCSRSSPSRTQALALLPAVATAVAIDGLRTVLATPAARDLLADMGRFVRRRVLRRSSPPRSARRPRRGVRPAAGHLQPSRRVPLGRLERRRLRARGRSRPARGAAAGARPAAERAAHRTGSGRSAQRSSASSVWIVASVAVLSASPTGSTSSTSAACSSSHPLVLTCFVLLARRRPPASALADAGDRSWRRSESCSSCRRACS